MSVNTPKIIPALALSLLLIGAAPAPAQVERPFRILVTNDDGISSEGITAVVQALRPFAEVVVSAPASNFSGASQSVTLFNGKVQVEAKERAAGVPGYAVAGTPADATIFALLELGKRKPFDLVISGINKGENVGDAVHVSGTVGAARQAAMMGIPAIAVSQRQKADRSYDFDVAARFTARLAKEMQRLGTRAPKLVSVNVPPDPKGVKQVPAGGSAFKILGFEPLETRGDGAATYVAKFARAEAPDPSVDAGALNAGYITLSILTLDPNERTRHPAFDPALLQLPAPAVP